MHEGPAPDVKRSLKAAADSSATWIFFPSFVVPVCWGHRTAICWPTVEGSLPNAAVRWVSQREKMRSTQMLRGGPNPPRETLGRRSAVQGKGRA